MKQQYMKKNNNMKQLKKIPKFKDEKEEPDDFVTMGGFVFGILGILIAIVAVILATRKSDSQKPSIEEEKPENETSSEEDSDT